MEVASTFTARTGSRPTPRLVTAVDTITMALMARLAIRRPDTEVARTTMETAASRRTRHPDTVAVPITMAVAVLPATRRLGMAAGTTTMEAGSRATQLRGTVVDTTITAGKR